MNLRYRRFATALVLGGAITAGPAFMTAGQREISGQTTQRTAAGPSAPAAPTTPQTPAAPPPALALKIKLDCYLSYGGWSASEAGVKVQNTTSKILPAGQKISWGISSSTDRQPRPSRIFTLPNPLPPGATVTVAGKTMMKKILDIEAGMAKGQPFKPFCEAFVGG